MYSIAITILAIMILFLLDYMPLVGSTLGGFLVLLSVFIYRVRKQGKVIVALEDRVRSLESARVDSAVESAASEDTPSVVDTDLQRQRDAWAQPPAPASAITAGQAQVGANEREEQEDEAPVAQVPATGTTSDTGGVPEPPSVGPSPEEPVPTEPARSPAEPAMPGLVERLLIRAWDWFTDGNIFVRVGIIILFVGMSFLIRYAINENMLPIELRLIGVAAMAIGLLYAGWRKRDDKPDFALMVQGGGIGLFYLTIFAGFSLYDVIPSTFAFVLLTFTVVLAAYLAIAQDSKQLALFAVIGGFLSPILTSSGSNNYIGLFSYYTVLNLGIVAVAWYKSWRILNFTGYIFTFGITGVWGVLSYRSEYFATTQPFLIIFFLLYVGTGVLFAIRRAPSYKDYIDSSIIFGTPLLAFGMQCALVNDFEYGIAISSFVLSAFYMVLSSILWKRYGDSLRLLSETFLALGVIFATLAIPFAIDGSMTGAVWAIEGAGILWISIRQEQAYRRLFGTALIFAAGVILAYEVLFPLSEFRPHYDHAFANSVFIGSVLIAISASIGSWLLSRDFEGRLAIENKLQYGLLAFGLFMLAAGFEYQVLDFELYATHGILLLILCAITMAAYTRSAVKLGWVQAHWVAVASVLPLGAAAVLCFAYQDSLSEHYGHLAWAIALTGYFYTLRQARVSVHENLLLGAHVLVAMVIVGLLFWDGLWQLLLGYSVLAVLFNHLGDRMEWRHLRVLALGFLPVLLICSIGAIRIDDNLVDLSSIGSGFSWPFPPGSVLWPAAFAVYFYLLYANRTISGHSTRNLHYAGGVLVAAMLMWLGLWPLLLGASLLCALAAYLWLRLSWDEMRTTSLALLPLMLLVVLLNLAVGNGDPFIVPAFNIDYGIFAENGYILWPLGFAVTFWTYWTCDTQDRPVHGIFHGLSIVALSWLLAYEASWHVLDVIGFMNGWHLALLPVTSMIAIVMILRPMIWPFTTHEEGMKRYAMIPLSLAIISWMVVQFSSPAHAVPLPWIPVVNPVDVITLMIIMGCVVWRERIIACFEGRLDSVYMAYAILGYFFVWANVDLLRAVHHWADVTWGIPEILQSVVSQTVLSLFWALAGLATTLAASRIDKRTLWFVGAALLTVVVMKLILVDSLSQGTIGRVISFTGVGILFVLVGYFSPIPPKKALEAGVADAN